MTHTQSYNFTEGGRVSTPGFRAGLQSVFEADGLADDTNGYKLLTLVKRVGKGLGFSPGMIRLLDHYMSFTRECDWMAGQRPIVYQSLSNTAMQLGLNERQIQYLEKALFEVGAITWNDSGNHRRYGSRDERTGELIFAFGVDLSPLASLKPAIEQKLLELDSEREAWHIAKRQISFYRRQIRAMLAEAQDRHCLRDRFYVWSLAYEAIIKKRIRVSTGLIALQTTLDEHKAFYETVYSALHTTELTIRFNQLSQKTSSTDAENCAHYNITTESQTNKLVSCNPPTDICLQGGVPRSPVAPSSTEPVASIEEGELIAPSGLDHITLRQVVSAASDRFLTHLSMQRPADDWNAVISAADELRGQLGIHNSAWIEACTVMGRAGAAICLLITDHNAQREVNRVHRPGGYFRAMIKKARVGELRLHSSIFGILKTKGETKQ